MFGLRGAGALALVSIGSLAGEGLKGPAGSSGRDSFSRLLGDSMKAIQNLSVKLLRDEQGGEVLEYALIVGLIIVGAIAMISSVGTKILARWTSLNNSM